ncbi:hypothetical protein BYT27DRAFT_7200805 [Phlegmacium glaucopus]|nr:hypothetical protein BYT27DRAFT_7200805 [Phlegmacium glaucopus]
MISAVTSTQAVGTLLGQPFDDLVAEGLWPSEQNISNITQVEIWTRSKVNGIRITYNMINDDPHVVMHGRVAGNVETVVFPGKHLVGVFGVKESGDDGQLRTIGFIIFDSEAQAPADLIELKGPFGDPGTDGVPYGAFGSIIAFGGKDDSNTGLESLSFYKNIYSVDAAIGMV